MMMLPWHIEWVRGLYGPTNLETGLRTKRISFTSMAKKQGKSVLLGVGPLIHLAWEKTELDPEGVGIATTKDQAKRVFQSAALFLQRCPELSEVLRVVGTTGNPTIMRKDNPNVAYQVKSGDGDKNDGIRASWAAIDEIHRFTTPKQKDNAQAVVRSGRGKLQPLTVIITTAGDPNVSEEWLNWYTMAKQALQDPASHPEMHVFIREADRAKLEADKDYWKSKEARLEANPSHEDFGGFIKDSELIEDLNRAISIPSEYRNYLRFTLNTATQSDEQWIPYKEWVECGQIPQRPLLGRDCIVGLDLSVTTDLTALAAVFPDDEGGYDLKVWFWMPGNAIKERERRDRKPYRDWVTAELIEATEGDSVNLQAVRDRIRWLHENFNVQRICYDPAHAQKLITELAYEDGFACEKQVQSGTKFSAAMRHLNDAILARKLRHGGDNPVLDWMAQCVVGKQNAKEEVHIAKPDRRKETTRVDGISATVTALCYAMTLQAVTGPTAWEQRA